MTKKLFILLLLSSSLFSSSVFTLDNIKNLKFHFTNNTYFMEKDEKQEIEKFIKNKLQKAGFVFGEVDPITFVVKVKSIEIDEVHVITVFIGLAEDVTTKRIDKIETYAFTYMADTLIESEDPYEDTLEAIDFLTCQFLTAYGDDNE
ncbi:MAG: hypothetical protein OQK48_02140 [Sulfurimonas sp.]|uniref:hypothetical protein n=1 Tax=Sulfurimonas sp. TaxID=2022749 RepID=UPI00262369BB|nr:hypothetical protein [Sulfurimonas sp.]MCW8894867.1 hypothetical protein [Sulfurimonas sp.]MCW8953723.1 hypothetical protein [Sulfurimonas sp.]MCW9067184.1 hypothetical protein [Sulfurimonas sp.]